jgi:hypothetical protein
MLAKGVVMGPSPSEARDSLSERSKGGDLRMHEMMDFQLWKQRREQLLCEAALNRQAKALRAPRKRRAGRRSALVWEMKRHAERRFKLLRILWNAG